MSVYSGKGGFVNGEPNVRTWRISYTGDVKQFVASNTKGGNSACDGNTDWKGSFTAYGHTPSVWVGNTFSFIGAFQAGVNQKGVSGTAIVDSIEIAWDPEGASIIGYTVNFSAAGALTLGTVTATDSSTPDCYSSKGCKVSVAATDTTPVYTDIPDVRSMTLTFAATNPSYNSSTTAGATNRVGGNINFSGSYTRYVADPAAADIMLPNTVKHLRFYANATDYWQLNFVEFSEMSDLETDIEGGKIVGCTQNFVMKGFATVGGTVTTGAIIDPASSTKWPV